MSPRPTHAATEPESLRPAQKPLARSHGMHNLCIEKSPPECPCAVLIRRCEQQFVTLTGGSRALRQTEPGYSIAAGRHSQICA
jgi:hypothetical protein